jgi:hypothetical protein
MYDYIRDELPALIQAEFAVNDRCAISGHSMGGHGALIMALKNPGNIPASLRSRRLLTQRRYRGDKKPSPTIWAKMKRNGRNGTAVR